MTKTLRPLSCGIFMQVLYMNPKGTVKKKTPAPKKFIRLYNKPLLSPFTFMHNPQDGLEYRSENQSSIYYKQKNFHSRRFPQG